ncbi:RNA polymerase sigma factor [Streptomyces sp. VTCC 41912]|uniref:RNA polymerase sigma factor n=1 Tax=Streptomyces sp. VTCC 41912 TaxID=3383243 RepID=UPI003896B584
MPGDPRSSQPPGDRARPDDGVLAARAAEGDEDAFETLVARHAPALLRLAVRLLDGRTEAEDAVQDAFVSAWRRLPDFQGRAAFGTWMYRIVTNRCLNLLRARRPLTDLDAVAEPTAPDHHSPARAAESRAAAKDLSSALSALSAEQRVCWILREVDGLTYDEIAETVGISGQAARARVFRARRCLTEAMRAWR